MVQAVGYLGSAGAAVMWIPQALRVVRHRRDAHSISGVSPAAYLMAMAFNALLVSYGLLNHAGPVMLAGCINLVCASVIVSVLLRARVPAR
jgi:uncharacterized protein with PQ loop repeat